MLENQDKTMLINLNNPKFISVAIVSAFLFSPLIQAAMYKWVDADGNTHYTQQPPPGDIEAKKIQADIPKVDSEGANSEIERQKEKADKLRKARQDQAKEDSVREQNEAIQAENCNRSKQQVSTYSRPRGLIEQEDGSRIRISEEQRLEGLSKAKEMVDKYCKPYYSE